MNRDKSNRYVLTGGPGAGKTTLIDRLARAGYAAMPEAGRCIIRQHRAIGGPTLPATDPLLFAELMLSWDIRSHSEAAGRGGPVFFDRGVPDVLGYLELCGIPIPRHMEQAATRFRYDRHAFILPPWREIFKTDGERRQSFAEAERTYEVMVEVYSRHGYALVEVPRVRVEERVHFVLAHTGVTPA